MIRNLKVMGMAVVALVAFSVVASAAQAASSFDVGKAPAILTATRTATPLKLLIKKETGSTTLSTVKCTTGTLSATTTTTNVTELTATPAYSGCTLGGLNATVDVNECTYTITNTATAKTANVDIVCPTGKELKITQGECTISVAGGQGPLEKLVGTNEGSGSTADVLAAVGVSMIKWSGSAGCPAGLASTSGTNAELEGNTTVRAFEDLSGVEGAQVSLLAT